MKRNNGKIDKTPSFRNVALKGWRDIEGNFDNSSDEEIEIHCSQDDFSTARRGIKPNQNYFLQQHTHHIKNRLVLNNKTLGLINKNKLSFSNYDNVCNLSSQHGTSRTHSTALNCKRLCLKHSQSQSSASPESENEPTSPIIGSQRSYKCHRPLKNLSNILQHTEIDKINSSTSNSCTLVDADKNSCNKQIVSSPRKDTESSDKRTSPVIGRRRRYPRKYCNGKTSADLPTTDTEHKITNKICISASDETDGDVSPIIVNKVKKKKPPDKHGKNSHNSCNNSVKSDIKKHYILAGLNDSSASLENSPSIDEVLSVSSENQLNINEEESASTSQECQAQILRKESKSVTQKLGSEWIKLIKQKTPEKHTNKSEHNPCPDSTKKKIAKGGHAARLKNLIQSWNSSICMWKHETSLLTTRALTVNKQEVCSIECKVEPLTQDSNKCSQISLLNTSIASLKQEDHNFLIQSPNFLNPVLKQRLMSPNVYSNSRRSLDISPISSKGSVISENTKFQLPAKYLHLKIISFKQCLPKNAALCSTVGMDDSLQVKTEDNVDSKTTESNEPTQYIVFFDKDDDNASLSSLFTIDSWVKIYAPWQQLDLPHQKYPVIFSSYYIFEQNNENNCLKSPKLVNASNSNEVATSTSPTIKRKKIKLFENKDKKKIIFSWKCACSEDKSMLPTMCPGQCENVTMSTATDDVLQTHRRRLETDQTGFNVITNCDDSINVENMNKKVWTVMEAIEKNGGQCDVPSCVTVRIYRIYSDRSINGEVEEWIIVGQDPSGMFLVLTVPHRPLAQGMMDLLLKKGAGPTYTFNNLVLAHRIHDTQNSSLFSLIWSLDKAYKSHICESETILPLLKNQVIKPRQSFIYIFTATLGQTFPFLVSEKEACIPALPKFPVLDLTEEYEGFRGELEVVILYIIGCYLYVTENTLNQKKESVFRQDTVQRQGGKVKRIMIHETAMLPDWLNRDTSVMRAANIKDVYVKQGKFIMDEYSSLDYINTRGRMTFWDLNQLLCYINDANKQDDLVLVKGIISSVDEENASAWNTCEHCRDHNIETMSNKNMYCQSCHKQIITPIINYYLVVKVRSHDHLDAELYIQLNQSTIVKLLSSVGVLKDQGYEPTQIKGKTVGPLVCVIKKVDRYPGMTKQRKFFLLELSG